MPAGFPTCEITPSNRASANFEVIVISATEGGCYCLGRFCRCVSPFPVGPYPKSLADPFAGLQYRRWHFPARLGPILLLLLPRMVSLLEFATVRESSGNSCSLSMKADLWWCRYRRWCSCGPHHACPVKRESNSPEHRLCNIPFCIDAPNPFSLHI